MKEAADAVTGPWRMERKFIVPGATWHTLAARVRCHPARFARRYPPRRINNIYFDTREFAHFNDCLDGTSLRRKIRIRWYGGFLRNGSTHRLEIKERRDLYGRKIGCGVAALVLEEGFAGRRVASLLRREDVPAELARHLRPVSPVLTNSYRREYWQTPDGRFRITLDRDVAFGRVDTAGGSARRGHVDRESAILELKYAPELDGEAALLMQHFPLRLSKHSKYVTGVQHLFGLFVDSPHS